MKREQTIDSKFKVGEGATIVLYSDRNACTVVSISPSGKKMVIQRDKTKLLNGFDSGEPDALRSYPGGFCAHVEGIQRYSYEKDENGQKYDVRLRKNGTWKITNFGSRVVPGRSEHYDYNF